MDESSRGRDAAAARDPSFERRRNMLGEWSSGPEDRLRGAPRDLSTIGAALIAVHLGGKCERASHWPIVPEAGNQAFG